MVVRLIYGCNTIFLDNITESCYFSVTMVKQLIADEQFTNIQRAQAGLTRLFIKAEKEKSFYRVLKNDKPLGVLIPQKIWEGLIEDLEALSSPSYLKRIAEARAEKKTISARQVKKILQLK